MGDFTWGATANISFMQYRINKLAGEKEIDLGMMVLREGETPFTYYLPHYEGVDTQTGWRSILVRMAW